MSSIQYLRTATKTKPHTPIRFVGTVTMTPAKWAGVTVNPRQRDTAKHAARAKHLRTPHAAHCKVAMARCLEDGESYKIDGHCRDFLWTNGSLEAPQELVVDVWECATLADVKELYRTYDSAGATETVSDKMAGGYREMGLQFVSKLLNSQRYANSMRIAYELLCGSAEASQMEVYDLLRYWRPELELIDSLQASRTPFPSGVHAGLFITLRRYGPRAIPFWEAYAKGLGTKFEAEYDAVQAFTNRVEKLRNIKALSGRDNCVILVGYSISAVEGFMRGQTYTQAIKPSRGESLLRWFQRAKRTERSWG